MSRPTRLVKAILDHEIKENIAGKLKIEADEERIAIIDYNEGLPSIRHGQVREWKDTFRFIDEPFSQTIPGSPRSGTLGSLIGAAECTPPPPCFPLQNDDLCRGLLRFGKKQPLPNPGLPGCVVVVLPFSRHQGRGTSTKEKRSISNLSPNSMTNPGRSRPGRSRPAV